MLGIYCRISQLKEEGKDRSINDQKLSGIALANKYNFLYEVYIDEGLSGTLPIDERPALSNLIDDIYKRKITKIYIYDQSRLERSPESRFALNKVFKEENIDVYDENGLIGKGIESEFAGDLMSVINNFYVKITAKKIKSVLRRNAEEGKAFGILPYGYKNEKSFIVINQEEAEIVKRIFEMSLRGIGINKIAEIFNEEKIKTRYNQMEGTLTTKNKYNKRLTIKRKIDIKWRGNTIRNIINNKVYKGVRVFSGIEYACDGLFKEQYWQTVNDNLQKNRNNSGKSVEHKYLLKGSLSCGKCGRNYYGRTSVSKKNNFYMCSSKRFKDENCGNRGINIDKLNELIWIKIITDGNLSNFVVKHFENAKSEKTVNKLVVESKILKAELTRLKNDKNIFLDYVLKGVLADEDIRRKLLEIKDKISTVELKIVNINSQLKSYEENLNNLTNILDELNIVTEVSFNDKQAIIKKYIEGITIYYDDVYFIDIAFRIPNMPNVTYVLERNYKYAHRLVSIDEVKAENELVILDSKIENSIRNNEEITLKLLLNSRELFEALKTKY